MKATKYQVDRGAACIDKSCDSGMLRLRLIIQTSSLDSYMRKSA